MRPPCAAAVRALPDEVQLIIMGFVLYDLAWCQHPCKNWILNYDAHWKRYTDDYVTVAQGPVREFFGAHFWVDEHGQVHKMAWWIVYSLYDVDDPSDLGVNPVLNMHLHDI